MNKITAWGATIIGIALLLPKIGINQLGTLTEGIMSWVIPIIVIIIGVESLIRKYKK